MTERERLVELITNGFYTKPVYEALCTNKRKACDFLADYLLENGVIVPPVKVGDTLFTLMFRGKVDLRDKDKPYKAKVVYIGINGSKNYVNVVYEKNDNMLTFTFDEIGDRIFLTREEAEKAVASK